jgi:hypothetical protein
VALNTKNQKIKIKIFYKDTSYDVLLTHSF